MREDHLSTDAPYGLSTRHGRPYDEADDRVRQALATEGFGVLTEIDVNITFKQKLDVDFRPYIILGAGNPPLAHQALIAEADIGLPLPGKVIVYQADNPDESIVAAIDPVVQLGVTGNDEIAPLSEEVRRRLRFPRGQARGRQPKSRAHAAGMRDAAFDNMITVIACHKRILQPSSAAAIQRGGN